MTARIYVRGTPTERFWAHVDKDGPPPDHNPSLGGCWLWVGYTRNGYGRFWDGERLVEAHIWAFGEVPDGLELDHLCRVRHCVRSSHLEPVTHSENTRRGTGWHFVAARARAKTHCPKGHPYDDRNTRVRVGKNGVVMRSCRECARREWRSWNARRKATNQVPK
jgi:hypothetical protein